MKASKKIERQPLDEFLEHGGATILPVTNPWEVVRFKTPRGTHVVYTNKQNNKTYSDDHAKEAYRAWIDGKPWIAKEKVNRRSIRYLIEAIRRRDGEECFFCCNPFTEENPETIEHLLAITSGGSNGIANLALAHEACNMKAGNLSVMEKIRMREKLRTRDTGGKDGN
jgi:hypothetical protein